MSDDICFLITVLQTFEHDGKDHRNLLQCAIKLKRDKLPSDVDAWPREHEALFAELLPPHFRSIGPIVDIQPIADVVDLTS